MIDFFDVIVVCENPAILKIILFIKEIIKVIFLIVPILLILMASMDLVKCVISNDSDMKKNQQIFIKRFLYTIFLFLVPTVVEFVLILVSDSVNNYYVNYQSCFRNSDYIVFFENKAKKIREKEKEEERAWYEELEKKNNFKRGVLKYSIVYDSNSSATSGGSVSGSGDLFLDWNDVTKISNATSTQLTKALNGYGGNAGNFLPYVNGLLQAEHNHNVNVFFLLGIEALESGWITSAVSGQCNNLGGVKFANQTNATVCTRSPEGDNYAKFNTKEAFIDYHASLLEKSYLTPGGSYYRGTTPESVVVSYCPGCSSWPSNVKSIGQGLFDKAKG